MSGQAISKLIEWLAGDDCHRADDGGLAEGLGQRLRAHGLPLDRLTLHLRTLHPEIFAAVWLGRPRNRSRSENESTASIVQPALPETRLEMQWKQASR